MDDIHKMIYKDALQTAVEAERSLIKAKICIAVLSCIILIQTVWRRC